MDVDNNIIEQDDVIDTGEINSFDNGKYQMKNFLKNNYLPDHTDSDEEVDSGLNFEQIGYLHLLKD